ncbi:GNAT family N-acetyltransferase [Paenibacillus sp. EC2-1]|uniref:GNAT family N-acetyltransferase n=1 Tax=Paenibacillus sp. EC2-1 TaxID=3388665 RepID=UPI003BEF3635
MNENTNFITLDLAFNKIKSEVLTSYNITDHKDKVIFQTIDIENDKQRMYDPSSDAFIPLKYTQFADGDIVISTISEYLDFAKKLYELYSENLFSKNAFEYIFEHLSVRVRDYDLRPYTANEEQEKYLIIYGLGDQEHIAHTKIQTSTVQIKSDTSYINVTDSYTELLHDRIYYGTLLGNKIVSIVGTNQVVESSQMPTAVDIGLETHEDYRQNGYAHSNVAAISKYLINKGHVVKYCCNNKNTNSIKTAISSGFKVVAYEKTIWCVNMD